MDCWYEAGQGDRVLAGAVEGGGALSEESLMSMQPLGELVRKRRKELRMSQRELAEKIGIPFQRLCELEMGNKPYKPDIIEPLADALNMDVEDIYAARVCTLLQGTPGGPLILDRIKTLEAMAVEYEANKTQLHQALAALGLHR
jgi:transcriptional regulator with XRE-family HTH domain